MLFLHQSNLVNFFDCPYKFLQSLEHKLEQTDAMRYGLLFEGYALGFKEDKDKYALEGRLGDKKLKVIKSHAELMKSVAPEIFTKGCEYYKKLSWEESKDITMVGETDIIDLENATIYDLKYTSDIDRIWGKKKNRNEFLQASYYPYMVNKIFGVKCKFIYILVENKFDNPIVQKITRIPQEEDYEYVEQTLSAVKEFMSRKEALIYEIEKDKCLGKWPNEWKCNFLEHCSKARNEIYKDKTLLYEEEEGVI